MNKKQMAIALDSITPTDDCDLTSGNEGFLEDIMRGMASMFKGQKPDFDIRDAKATVAEIKKTYANKTWLDKRKPADGPIELTGAEGGVVKAGADNVIKAISAELAKASAHNAKVVNYVALRLKDATAYLESGAWQNDKDMVEGAKITKRLAETFHNMPEFRFANVPAIKPATVSIPALSNDKIIQTANRASDFILYLSDNTNIDGIDSFEKIKKKVATFKAFFKKEVPSGDWRVSRDNALSNYGYVFEALEEAVFYVEEGYRQDEDKNGNMFFSPLVASRPVIKALIELMDKSVK